MGFSGTPEMIKEVNDLIIGTGGDPKKIKMTNLGETIAQVGAEVAKEKDQAGNS